jgi:molybdate transport system permease protein
VIFRVLTAGSLALALAFLALPVAAIFLDAPPGELLASLGDPAARDALRLSLQTTFAALALIVAVGTPAAWLLATRRFRGHALVTTLVELPLVLPPAVAGIGLLAALGPQGLLGGAVGESLALTTAAVVVALTFVAAPYYLRQAQAAFAALEPSWLDASRTLGAGEGRTFALVAVPATLPALGTGMALAWGRALGEFGATLVFAGSFRGITQTAPLAIYERVGTDFTSALALSAVLVGLSAGILVGVKWLAAR